MRDIFERYYQTNFWKNEQSVSGPGSTLQATANIQRELSTLFINLGILNIVDAACGDFNWMRKVIEPLPIAYLGYDIVPELIAENNRKYGDDMIEFRTCDITLDTIRQADLILARDVLVHLSLYSINEALRNFRRSGSKWLLATTFPDYPIENIETGAWRPVDLSRLRFGLGPPELLLREDSTPKGELFENKSLGLWRLNK